VLLEHLIQQDPERLELLVIQLHLAHQYHPVLLEHQHLTVPQLLALLMDLLILERLVTQHLKRLALLVRLALPEHLKEKFLPLLNRQHLVVWFYTKIPQGFEKYLQ
jgi:hypothetical protein